MGGELLIAAGPGEWRAAWIENGDPAELYVERGDIRPTGSIHLGRVVRRVAGLDAALVEIGEERPAFLPWRGAGPDEGARVMVQVRRETQRGKGALLTTRLARREGHPDAARLQALAAGAEPPAQLDPAPSFAAALALRLPAMPERVCVDDAAVVAELRQGFPGVAITHRATETWPIDLDAAFAAALAPSVPLPGGGSLHFDAARAAVLIDVDTGSPETGSAERSAAAANLAAAQAIARHIRLRQLAGGIVVDFAALDGRAPRERVRQALAGALEGDPAQPKLLGWTRLGHLEIVRPRRGRPLAEAMLEPQSPQKSALALAFEALRTVYREARARPAAKWRLIAAPAVEAALRGPAAAALRGLEARLARPIALAASMPGDHRPFDIVPL